MNESKVNCWGERYVTGWDVFTVLFESQLRGKAIITDYYYKMKVFLYGVCT